MFVRKNEETHGQIRTVYEEMKTGTWAGNARRRAARRKSKWNLLLPAFIFPLWFLLWWVGVELAWWAHLLFACEGSTLLNRWTLQSMNLGTTPPAVLMTLAPMLPALTGAMVLGNWLVCSIPPA